MTLSLVSFSKKTGSRDGLAFRCKKCCNSAEASRYASDPERVKANVAAYRATEIGRLKTNSASAARYAKNPKRAMAYSSAWAKTPKGRAMRRLSVIANCNPAHNRAMEKLRRREPEYQARKNAQTAQYRMTKISATPAWANVDEIAKKYAEAARMTKETGILHHVDHIWPLKGIGFVGLHVEYNLQILTATDNLSKGNRVQAVAS